MPCCSHWSGATTSGSALLHLCCWHHSLGSSRRHGPLVREGDNNQTPRYLLCHPLLLSTLRVIQKALTARAAAVAGGKFNHASCCSSEGGGNDLKLKRFQLLFFKTKYISMLEITPMSFVNSISNLPIFSDFSNVDWKKGNHLNSASFLKSIQISVSYTHLTLPTNREV